MEEINKIRKITIWIFLIPFISINLCLLIVIFHTTLDGTIFQVDVTGRLDYSIPYFSGGFSISRAARAYPSYFIFKPFMVLTSLLLIRYWILNKNLINSFGSIDKSKYFLFFGIGSAIFLIFHSLMLGMKFDFLFLKFFRRFVLIAFIIFELIAQALLIVNLIKLKNKIKILINKNILIYKSVLIGILIIVALLSIPILASDEYKNFKHALEWNYFIGVVLFYFLSRLLWKKTNSRLA